MNINQIVDEILNEKNNVDKSIMFAVISETKGFAESANYIRHYPGKNKCVFMCETMEKLLPLSLASEMLGNVQVLKSDYFTHEPERLKNIEKIIIPVFPLNLASSLANLSGDGVVSNMLCHAVTYKIPILASYFELHNSVCENPDLKDKVSLIKKSLESLGVIFFTRPIFSKIKSDEERADIQIVGELIEHFNELCELEEGANCINCTKCKVRGF